METTNDKNREKSKEDGKKKREKNLIPFKPGQSGNPAGKKKGVLSFRTKFLRAVELLAEREGVSSEDVQVMLTYIGIERAFKKDFRFWKELHDRVHGQTEKPHTIDLKGKIKVDENKIEEMRSMVRRFANVSEQAGAAVVDAVVSEETKDNDIQGDTSATRPAGNKRKTG